MPYCFMRYEKGPDREGWSPSFPDSASFVLLANGGEEGDWGLWEYRVEESDGWTPEHPVRTSLAALIESGKRYPPALALARQETRQVCGGIDTSQEDLERAYTAALQHHLARQHEARYILAMALNGDGIDRREGEWYWIVAVDQSTVSWVSDDFFVYGCALADFDLTGAQLKRLG